MTKHDRMMMDRTVRSELALLADAWGIGAIEHVQTVATYMLAEAEKAKARERLAAARSAQNAGLW